MHSRDDQILMQKDLHILKERGNTWGMRFNASKCNIIHIACTKETITQLYTLGGQDPVEVHISK